MKLKVMLTMIKMVTSRLSSAKAWHQLSILTVNPVIKILILVISTWKRQVPLLKNPKIIERAP